MRNTITRLALVVLSIAVAATTSSAASASQPSAVAAAHQQIVGECWGEGGKPLYREELGGSSDPGFPDRAQEFSARCLRSGGTAKFLEQSYTQVSIGDVTLTKPGHPCEGAPAGDALAALGEPDHRRLRDGRRHGDRRT